MDTENTTPTTTTAAPVNGAARTAHTIAWYRPAVDVYEGDEGLTILLDMPGVKPDGFEVNVESRVLTVQGVRSHGTRGWRRVFTLPDGLDAGRIEAKAEHGVLKLILPKREEMRPRRIEVK